MSRCGLGLAIVLSGDRNRTERLFRPTQAWPSRPGDADELVAVGGLGGEAAAYYRAVRSRYRSNSASPPLKATKAMRVHAVRRTPFVSGRVDEERFDNRRDQSSGSTTTLTELREVRDSHVNDFDSWAGRANPPTEWLRGHVTPRHVPQKG